ncbi:S-layer homology domain-containing protein [Candidatus Gracilibacteria bacterium]|nr:S-layer homology domain-containing protein [Candidatus Gracilibacteria bacterium]MCF7819618.1 S-layer homology domain-containing protein [Candidatus Gracilibacteria bacterium]
MSFFFLLVFSLFFFVPESLAAVPTFTASIQAKDGTTDKILLTFSEAVSTTSGSAGELIVAGDFAVAGTDGLTIAGVSHVANSPSVVLTMSANINLAGAGELTIACAATEIYDNGGTNACVQGATDINTASVDTTGPTVSNIHWLDNDSDGDIDRAEIQWNEPVDDSTIANTDFEFDNDTSNDGTGEEVGSGGGTAVTSVGSVDLVDDEYSFVTVSTGIAGTEAANLHILGANTTDLLGNAVATADNVGTDADRAAPQISTFTYQDNDGDGKADRFLVAFSETLDATSVLGANDLTLTNVGDFTGASFGNDATDLIAGAVNNVLVGLGTEASVIDTAENSGSIAISSQNAFSLTDGTNTNSTLGAQSQALFADGAGPLITSWTLDLAIPSAKLNFSESVEAGTLAVGSITIQNDTAGTLSHTLTTSSTTSSNGTSIVIDISDSDLTSLTGIGNLVTSQSASYLSATATAIDDLASNDLSPIASSAGIGVSSYNRRTSGGSESNKECIPPKIISFSPDNKVSSLEQIQFEILPQQNSDVWTNFGTARDMMTVTVAGKEIARENITLTLERYVVATVSVDFVTSGSVDIALSVPSRTNEGPCFTEEIYTISVGNTAFEETPSTASGGNDTNNISEETYHPSASESPRADQMKQFTNVVANKKSFQDIPITAWERSYVDKVSSAGIMTGYADGSNIFGKDDPVTNAQLTKVGLESFGYDIPSRVSLSPFDDVSVNDWSAPYFQKAKTIGVTPLRRNGRINPHQPISRGETLRILVDMAEIDLSGISDENYFSDVPTSKNFTKAIAWATENGIVNGYQNGNFGPNDSLTRGQLAKIVVNMLEFLGN